MLSKSTALNEMLSFKKDLEKSERKYTELSDQLEVIDSNFEFLLFLSLIFSQ